MNWDSAGLMPQIQALIAFPPGTYSANSTKSKVQKHPYYKKPGRSHNHDTCDFCSEAGDLLCCDTCDASFHLFCINPPLHQIPNGGWCCRRCSAQLESGQDLGAGSKSSKSARRAGKKRAAPPPPPVIAPKQIEVPSEKSLVDFKVNDRILGHEGNVVEKFFQRVVSMARQMNPEQYLLPKELMNYGAQQFPGAPRPTVTRQTIKRQPKASKQIIEMENGMVPSPRVVCFVCDTSCRKGPMIRCDSCSACFHFDCLNPPLTGVPQGRWRCHLHTEHILEQKVLKSLSLTERVALYDKSAQPFDPIQAALNFVTKSQRAKNYFFRRKAPYKGKATVKIPEAIANCYSTSNSSDEDDSLEWPDVQEITKRIYNGDEDKDEVNACETSSDGAQLKLLADVAEMLTHEQILASIKAAAAKQNSADYPFNSGFEPTEIKPSKDSSLSNSQGLGFDLNGQTLEQRLIELKAKNSKIVMKELEKHNLNDEELLEGLDMKAIRSLAALKLRELRSDESIGSSVSDMEVNQQPSVDIVNSSSLNQSEPTSNSLIPKEESQEPEDTIKLETDETMDDIEEEEAKMCDVEIPLPYVTLQILNSKKEIKFEGGSLSIGRGEDNDLDLREHSGCTTPADEHCVIFYDSVCATWELLNYSPNGTFVNRCLYGCDGDKIHSRKSQPTKPNPLQEIVDPAYNRFRVRKALEAKKDQEIKKDDTCACINRARNYKNVWEGGAKLCAGSRIQIGCVKIVVVGLGVDSKIISHDNLKKNDDKTERITKFPIL